MDHLSLWYGIRGTALSWLKPFEIVFRHGSLFQLVFLGVKFRFTNIKSSGHSRHCVDSVRAFTITDKDQRLF